MMNIILKIKPIIATVIFALFGIYSSIFIVTDWKLSLPLVIFYFILTINTFFSIKLFTKIIDPKNVSQIVIDTILFCLYFLLAYKVDSYFWFSVVILALFIVAIVKYIFLLNLLQYQDLLNKKIFINSLGTVACILNYLFAAFDYGFQSAWALVIVFAVANIYLLVINPMYRIS
ncbi:hypothetical protein IT397_01260 [Candidatus Nomurabacteria bacterium]|nr:hypothetical protein [Candidatus Nomurabacteria bacterium]